MALTVLNQDVGWAVLLKALGGSVFLPFQVLDVACIPWLVTPSVFKTVNGL